MKQDNTDVDRAAGEFTVPRVSLKTNIALMLLATPSFRRFSIKPVLRHLVRSIFLDPETMAFALLTRLLSGGDAVFKWHLLNLMLRIPEEVFERPRIRGIVPSLEDLPGDTLRQRVSVCKRALSYCFYLPLLHASNDYVKMVDYARILQEVRTEK
jgi:hypothetical protein